MGPNLLGTSIASVTLHVAAFAELPPATLYALLQLRVQVFVVEQRCPYQDLDGRDTDPGTRHVWLAAPRGSAGSAWPLRRAAAGWRAG